TEVALERLPGQHGSDLVIDIPGVAGGPQGQVTITGQFDSPDDAFSTSLSQIVFSDGVVWTQADIKAHVLALEEAEIAGGAGPGGAGRVVTGFAGSDDTLTAGAGAAELVGGSGSDTYVWAPGDGMTRIDDQGGSHTYTGIGTYETNTLRLEGVAPSAVTVERD